MEQKMTKIEEIYRKHWIDKFQIEYISRDLESREFIFNSMKEYADYHLQMYIESIIPALLENVETYPSRDYIQVIDPRKLIKLKLPEHE